MRKKGLASPPVRRQIQSILMVAPNESFAPANPVRSPKNRVGNFFGESGDSRPANRLSGRHPRRENGHDYGTTASGTFYYGFRYYVPETGRWLSRDPIAERGGLNLFAFVGNDVLNKLDYLGMAQILTDLMQDVQDGVSKFDLTRNTFEVIKANLGPTISPGQYQYNGPISTLLKDSASDLSKKLLDSIVDEVDFGHYFENYTWETGSVAVTVVTTASILVFTGNVDVNQSVQINIFRDRVFQAGPCEIELFVDVIPFVEIRNGEFEKVDVDYEVGVRTNFRF